MSVNVTPPSIGPTVNVSVDPLAVQRAEAAAAAAEAAKVAAETAATTAASSAAAAASSKTDAEAAAAAASASESAAAASQAAAAASAAAALASEIAAGTSETNAAISAAAAAASQSAAAASAAAAAASESAAAASASAASTSETNAAASAAAATTQAGIATTKAGESATSATDAEAAKNAVEGILDFTTGNLYRGNGTGIAAVNEVDLLKNKTIFEKSVVEAFSTPSVFAWDNVNRSDTAVFSGAGNLDSGQAWQNLAGQNGNVVGNTVRLATTINQNAVLAFERTSFSSTGSVLCDFVWRGDNNTNGRFFIGKDADNGICFRIGIFTNSIIARIAGVETIINSNSISLDVSQANAFTKLRMSILLVRGGLSNKGYAVITFKDLNVSLIASGSGFDTAVNNIFSAASEVKYIGLQMSTSISVGVGINNLKCFSI